MAVANKTRELELAAAKSKEREQMIVMLSKTQRDNEAQLDELHQVG